MEKCFGSGGSSSTDQTTSRDGSGSRSGSWMEQSNRRRRFSSPTPNAFLGPAFNACATSPQSDSPVRVNASLLRYTRSSRLLLSSSSSSSDSPSLASSTGRSQLFHLLQLRSTLTSSTPLGSSGSPMSAVDGNQLASSPPYKTPVKVEVDEDVLVMDGIMVTKSGSTRIKPSFEFVSTASSSSSATTLYKTDICRPWEESGFCRYGSKCQFAHGKEEVRCGRPLKPTKFEMGKSVPAAGSCVYGARFRQLLPAGSAAGAQGGPTRFGAGTTRTAAPPGRAPASSPPPETTSSFVWPPTEAEDKYIEEVLYGPSRRKRLPAFVEICSEN